MKFPGIVILFLVKLSGSVINMSSLKIPGNFGPDRFHENYRNFMNPAEQGLIVIRNSENLGPGGACRPGPSRFEFCDQSSATLAKVGAKQVHMR